MRLNPISLVGLLGFAGLLGLATNNPGFYGFFGFFSWFSLAKLDYDERFRNNLNRAAKIGYVLGVFALTALIVMLALRAPLIWLGGGIAATFVLMIFSFVIMLQIYDRRGD